MAGDWIVWTKGLARKREVRAMAKMLSLDRKIIAASCMEVWEWADNETTDGTILGITEDAIDEEAGIPGFAKAMSDPAVGWLEISPEGIRFPNWERNNGQSAKKRAQDRRRKHGSNSDFLPQLRGQFAEKNRKESGTPERTGKKIKEPETGSGSGSGAFASLTDSDLRSTGRMLAWHRSQAANRQPIIGQSEADRLRILAAAEAALATKQPKKSFVAVFAHLISRNRPIAGKYEDLASQRLREFLSNGGTIE